MNDKDHVESAYAALVDNLFKVFFQSFTAAKGDKTAEAAAENTFKNGMTHLRHVRDRAIAVLP